MRHGFQDVERLGKQYAALNSSRLPGAMSEKIDAFTERGRH